MKIYKRIITVVLSLVIVFTLCLPALATPAEAVAPAAAFDQVGSDASITLNNGDVLRVPAEAITGNYIVYRVNNGVYRYYVIDVFENTDGVKEMAFLSFTRYVGQHAITNANALSPNVWTIYGMQNVLYAISGALTVRPMYSTFDYYDALGFLLIGGYGSETTEDDFSGTFEVDTPENDFTLPREIMGEHFMVINDPDSKTLDTIQVVTFPNYENGNVYEGAFVDYNQWSIAEFSLRVSSSGILYDLPNDYDHTVYPYLYALRSTKAPDNDTFVFIAISYPAISYGTAVLSKWKGNTYKAKSIQYTYSSGAWGEPYLAGASNSAEFSSSSFELVWSNTDVCNSSTGEVTWSPASNFPAQIDREWSISEHLNTACTFSADGWDILYSTFDYYDSNGNLLYGNSFAGEVTEDDSLIDLTLDDGTVIRVPERFGERDSYYVVMDPVGGTEETAYLIYEFDYYEGVADGTICDFTRWYGVATTTDDVTTWEWNYQDYYVTELDILDYGPIVYSTFEYVDGRTDEEEEPSGDGATSEEVKGFWNKLLAKVDQILEMLQTLLEKESVPSDEDADGFFKTAIDIIFRRTDQSGETVNRVSNDDISVISGILDKFRIIFDTGFKPGEIFSIFDGEHWISWFSIDVSSDLDTVNGAAVVGDDDEDPYNHHYADSVRDYVDSFKTGRGGDS